MDDASANSLMYFMSLAQAVEFELLEKTKDIKNQQSLIELKHFLETWMYEDSNMSLDTATETIQNLLKNISGLDEYKK